MIFSLLQSHSPAAAAPFPWLLMAHENLKKSEAEEEKKCVHIAYRVCEVKSGGIAQQCIESEILAHFLGAHSSWCKLLLGFLIV